MGSETHGSFWGSIPMPKKPRSVDVRTGIDYFASEALESRWESVLSTVQDAVTQALRQDKRRVPIFLSSTPSYWTNEKEALEDPPKMWATYVEVLLKWVKHKLLLMLLGKFGSLQGTQNRNIFAQRTGFSSRRAHDQPWALVCRYLLWFIQNAANELPITGGPGHEQPKDLFILACQQEDYVSHQTDMIYHRGGF